MQTCRRRFEVIVVVATESVPHLRSVVRAVCVSCFVACVRVRVTRVWEGVRPTRERIYSQDPGARFSQETLLKHKSGVMVRYIYIKMDVIKREEAKRVASAVDDR